MNKVVNINLNGFIFSIDEQAYELLKQYIDRLRSHFAGAESSAEIISDIETRIAELLNQKLNEQNQVVQLPDVQHVIAMMGEPWQMDEEHGGPGSEQAYSQLQDEQPRKLRRDPSNKVIGGVCSGVANYLGVDPVLFRVIFAVSFFIFGTGLLIYIILWIALPEARQGELSPSTHPRKMFRNPDDKVIGGVCGGMGNYFGIDPVWLRIAFLVAFFFFGTGLLLYIILWISISKASTAAEKLQMKGEPVDVHNIQRVVKNSSPKQENKINRAGNMLTDLLKNVFILFSKLAGFIILAWGIGLLVIFFMFLLNPGGTHFNHGQFNKIVYAVLGNGTLAMMAKLGWTLIVVSLSTVFILSGIRLLFTARFKTRIVNVILLILFLSGCVIVGVSAANFISSVYREESSVEKLDKTLCPDTLYIHSSGKWADEMEARKVRISIRKHEAHFSLFYIDGEGMLLTSNKLILLPAKDDSLFIQVKKVSHGSSDEEALSLAQKISYETVLSDSLITLDPAILVAEGDPYKFQRATVKMRIPAGTIICLDKEVAALLSRSENTYGSEAGKIFRMTEDGLRCLDCDDKDDNDDIETEVEDKGEISIDIGGDKDESGKDEGIHIKINGKEKGNAKERAFETETIENRNGKVIKTKVKKVGPVTVTESEEIKR